MQASRTTRIVADVGGTNTRIALFDSAVGELRALHVYRNRDYSGLESVISHWLEVLPEPVPDSCCIAVAAPPSDDRVVMFNLDWSFSCRELAAHFGFRQWRRLNDFESNAHALPFLAESDRRVIHQGQAGQTGRLAVMGPGTGLGGAVLDQVDGVPRSLACEPGHSGLSPGNDLELELFRMLLPRYGNIYAELLVSGPGLLRLYLALGEIRGEPTGDLRPAEISARAIASQENLCVLALDTFCALLGSACGDFLLANGAYGGLYLAGGILPGMIPYLGNSGFQQRLCTKGGMVENLDKVPVYVITTGQPGLIGAAHAPLNDPAKPGKS